jgi:hypothetical protein
VKEIQVGDWVEINCPHLPWFHGQVAEVVELYPSGYFSGSWSALVATLAISFTPGHTTTNWNLTALRETTSPYAEAVRVLGEDYFA